ncbi:MAG: ANTAR domain-containing protein [Gemmataceae bacterium]
MMRYAGLDEEEVFRRLWKMASDRNRKVVEVAQDILVVEKAFQQMEQSVESRSRRAGTPGLWEPGCSDSKSSRHGGTAVHWRDVPLFRAIPGERRDRAAATAGVAAAASHRAIPTRPEPIRRRRHPGTRIPR